MLEGGCFCGAVRYAIDDGDYLSANCHCSMCRRAHAAPFVTWLVVPTTRFRWTAGEPTALRSSADGTRRFCPACGTHLTCVNATHPEIVDVTVGSLDAPDVHPPTMAVFEDTRLAWVPANGN